MTTRNFRVMSAVFILTIFVLTGCGAAGNSATATLAGETDITIAAVPSADLASVYIAQDDGFFAKEGLRVNLVKVPSSQAIIAEQLAGKIDLCAGAYTPYISAEAAGKRFPDGGEFVVGLRVV